MISYTGISLFENIYMPIPYNTIATANSINTGKTTLLPVTISIALKRVNIVKYFRFSRFPPIFDNICIKKKVIGIPAPMVNERLVSLLIQEAKKHIHHN